MTDQERVLDAYSGGLSIMDTSRVTGVSKWRVERIIANAGVARSLATQYETGMSASGRRIGRPAKEIAPEDLEALLQAYGEGTSARQLARRYGLNHHRVTDIVREATGQASLTKGGYGGGGRMPGTVDRSAETAGMMVCAHCREEKAIEEFVENASGKYNGRMVYCKPCWSSKVTRKAALRFKYDISVDRYHEMFEKQGGVCAICRQPETSKGRSRLSVDHCHSTERVRGLLCSNCNHGLGHFRDSIELMNEAIDYLIKSRACD